ncbi:MAG: ABC transporter permease [Lachnospiraceae bacterium]|nr:ABC transporter permease [Lachnospiraceae bacterium]
MSKLSEHGSEVASNSKDYFFSEQNPKGYKQYWFVIHELTSRELKRKYARSYLGVVWSILSPLLSMVVISFIFSYMFRRSIENFPVYYLIGLTIWTLFKTATDHSMTALVDNKQLLLRAKLPKYTFILSRINTAFVNFLYSVITMLIIMFCFRIEITWRILLFIPVIFLLLLFSLGIGLILSIIYVFFADIKYLYEILLTLWMYLSAIFYPTTALPDYAQSVIYYNPIFLAIDISRSVLQYGQIPPIYEWIRLIICALISFICGILVFKKFEGNVMRKI